MEQWKLNYGANLLENGDLHFKVWAPLAKTMFVVSERKEYPMTCTSEGVFELTLPQSYKIKQYRYKINDNARLCTDPVSRSLPQGVNGPTAVYDPHRFKWTDTHWKGIPLNEYIFYELHVGLFSSQGTFEAIIDKLKYLKDLGVTAIELMPIIEFPGARNWGYDGVSLFAPHHVYGGPDALKHLIDACHKENLAVVLDVVYNHLGPEQNFLSQFGYYFTDHYKTPWGQAINYDGPYSDEVRKFIINNALYWLTEFHIDALRLDAVHAIYDFSARHILEELSEKFHEQARLLNRKAYLTAESDLNDVKIIKSKKQDGYGIDAQWSDDFHHAVHAYLTKSDREYFADFGSLSDIAKAITDGFVYDGKVSQYRKRIFGSISKNFSGEKFVHCIQNHDQVGNATLGKRLGNLLTEEQYKIAAMLLMAAPGLPLLFMGQEWNAETEFLYFTSFEDENLAKSVREGYQKEFNLDHTDTFDPQNEQRFVGSKLNWNELKLDKHEQLLGFFKKLIYLRKTIPAMANGPKDMVSVNFSEEEQWLVMFRKDEAKSKILLIANFADTAKTISTPLLEGTWKQDLSSNDSQLDVRSPTIVPPTSAFLFSK